MAHADRDVSSRCNRRGCTASITWAETVNGKRMPLDVHPNPAGNVAVWRDPTRPGVLCAFVFNPATTTPKVGETIYMPHKATCRGTDPDADKRTAKAKAEAAERAKAKKAADRERRAQAALEPELFSNVLPIRGRR